MLRTLNKAPLQRKVAPGLEAQLIKLLPHFEAAFILPLQTITGQIKQLQTCNDIVQLCGLINRSSGLTQFNQIVGKLGVGVLRVMIGENLSKNDKCRQINKITIEVAANNKMAAAVKWIVTNNYVALQGVGFMLSTAEEMNYLAKSGISTIADFTMWEHWVILQALAAMPNLGECEDMRETAIFLLNQEMGYVLTKESRTLIGTLLSLADYMDYEPELQAVKFFAEICTHCDKLNLPVRLIDAYNCLVHLPDIELTYAAHSSGADAVVLKITLADGLDFSVLLNLDTGKWLVLLASDSYPQAIYFQIEDSEFTGAIKYDLSSIGKVASEYKIESQLANLIELAVCYMHSPDAYRAAELIIRKLGVLIPASGSNPVLAYVAPLQQQKAS